MIIIKRIFADFRNQLKNLTPPNEHAASMRGNEVKRTGFGC